MSDVQNEERIFAADEMQIRKVEDDWDEPSLLSQEGIFFLKDVVKALDLSPVKLKKEAKDCEDSWEEMGIRKTWTHWIVRMKVFSKWYEKRRPNRIQRVNPDWDGNELLQQRGKFFLTEVCEKIPFSSHQIRYQAKKNKNARVDYGIWKEPEYSAFVVQMEVFSKWVRKLWAGDFT